MLKTFLIPKEIKVLIFLSIITLAVIKYFALDFYFADLIYQSTNSWQYQNHWFTTSVIHKLGKYLLILIYLIMLFMFFKREKTHETPFQRYSLIILLCSILIGTLVVSVLKKTLNVDCPWDLIQYGGTKPYFSLFHYNASYLPSSHCFPSGHASSAFTWISLYFYASMHYPKQRLKILTALLITGFSFGLSQQLRGAHFISHDIFSLLSCVGVNILIYKLAFGRKFMVNVLKLTPKNDASCTLFTK
jgi:membrane-associated PAP2 superfamily phosphatase